MTDLSKATDPTRRLYQLIADKVRALIQQGDYKEGSRLPPERDLAQQLGVSRPSLREALIALEIEGSVEIRMGSGVYVCSRALRRNPMPPSMGESPAELMQARGALEGAVIVLACVNATPKDWRGSQRASRPCAQTSPPGATCWNTTVNSMCALPR
ncbi:FadR/GntR family transcriptional regulator [Acidovorax sp. 1608163]|uniref:FadR/GntR family transcriptional regulator n=1 Tax=Acidovorax sp. 1608163 TaxID=2478662 RepID=UPI0026AB4FA8